ncbi:MAG: hypothetical protein GMKNLPBB_02127 [Myxococcota bacterium]|nr:hypothetical protein [Myxococcota bacterium]
MTVRRAAALACLLWACSGGSTVPEDALPGGGDPPDSALAAPIADAASADDGAGWELSGPGDTAPADAAFEDVSPPDSAPPADGSAPDGALPPVPPDAVVVPVFRGVRINSRPGDPLFQAAEAEADFGPGPFRRVILRSELGTTCYPFENWRANPPPPGHNFPASCDAFDRNYEFTLNEPRNPGDPPAIELVRAITPFGGPLFMDTDITDIANGRPGKNRIRVHIATWSDGAGKVSGADGGWNVTASLIIEPGPAPRKVAAVIPLLNTSIGADYAVTPFAFAVPPGVGKGRIEFRVTGHGGGPVERPACIGPAEEFCQRNFQFYLNGALRLEKIPWRDDCARGCTITRFGGAAQGFDYCRENPTGAIQSVRAPRANWCPGSVTPPIILEDAVLAAPGEQKFAFRVSRIAPGGSFRVSAVYIGHE